MEKEPQKIDYLNRQPYVDKLKEVIGTLSKNKSSCTFALDGEWGVGKTFVLDMLEEQIKDHYLVIRYNAWENDFYDEPLIAILYTFANTLNDLKKNERIINNITKEICKELFERIANGFLSIIGQITKSKFGVDVVDLTRKGLKKAKEFKDKYQQIENDGKIDLSFDKNSNLQEVKKQIVLGINELSEYFSVVVMVDELDRCLPEYAITVLERLHHIFNDVKNTQVILSLSIEQLSNTVAKLFEFEETSKKINVDNYFKKFYSFKIILNEGDSDEKKRDRRFDYYASKFSIQFATTTQQDVDDFRKKLFSSEATLINGIKITGFNARQQCLIIEKANLIHNLISSSDLKLDKVYMCAELLLTVFFHEIWDIGQVTDGYSIDYDDIINKKYYFQFISNTISQRVYKGQYSVVNTLYSMDHKNNYTIKCDDIWGYLWYTLFALKTETEGTWKFDSKLSEEEIKQFENHINNFAKLLKIIR